VDGRDIQMVGRLIEQKKIRVLIQEACESGSHFPAAAQGVRGLEFLLFNPRPKGSFCQVEGTECQGQSSHGGLSQFNMSFIGLRVRRVSEGGLCQLCSFNASEGMESSTTEEAAGQDCKHPAAGILRGALAIRFLHRRSSLLQSSQGLSGPVNRPGDPLPLYLELTLRISSGKGQR
jgi:hypothetical protein